jgi:hypothetical protein
LVAWARFQVLLALVAWARFQVLLALVTTECWWTAAEGVCPQASDEPPRLTAAAAAMTTAEVEKRRTRLPVMRFLAFGGR